MSKKLFVLPILSILMLSSCGPKVSDRKSDVFTGNSAQSQETPKSDVGSDTKDSTSSKKDPVPEPAEMDVVTFDLNFADSTPVKVNAEKGKTVNPIDTPTRQGYLFNGWTTDKEGTTAYDFSAIKGNITVYAQWIEDNDDAVSVTFHWNFDGSEKDIFYRIYVRKNSRVKAITPTRDGYYFKNWYTTSDFSSEYKPMQKYQENTDLYARWFNRYTFEAEYTQLTDLPEDDVTANDIGEKIGYGYSSNVTGLGLIQTDGTMSTTCSNHKYITDLYYNGAYLEFDITADEEIEDAIFIATLTAEYFDMSFSTENKQNADGTYVDSWLVNVNGTNLDYGTIDIKNVITDRSDPDKRPFTDFTLSTGLNLKKGENVIKLITNNSRRKDSTGTMAAMAPMIDCLKFYTDENLTFREFNKD